MENKKKFILFLGGITLGMVITSIMISFIISKVELIDKTTQVKVNSSNVEEEVVETKKEEIVQKEDKKETKTQKNETVSPKKETKKESQTNYYIENETTEEFETQDEIVEEIIENEEVYVDNSSQEVLDYFKELDNKIFTEENIQKFTSSVKTSFITITDFIFYGTEINGYTFNDLTEQAKLYVMDIAIKLDSKIESYHPGYKDEIRLKLYDIKEELTIKYLEVSDKICTEIGEVACEQARSDLETMKENFGLTVDFVKVITKSGLDSLKNWYEIFKKSN